LVQYDRNPATAMKESITRRRINEHRKAIEDKKKELLPFDIAREHLLPPKTTRSATPIV
jgi:hypothetical protein